MADFLRIGAVARAAGVSVETLRLWEDQGRVDFERHANQRVLHVDQLGPLIVSLSTSRTSGVPNRLEGTIVAVDRDGVMTAVEVICGDYRIVSLISRDAAEELGVEVGKVVTAVIPATAVIIEC